MVVLVMGVIGPAHSQEAVTGTGTSTLSLAPADLALAGLPIDVDTTLGSIVAQATNVEGALASLSLEGVGAAGDLAPPLTVTSADGDKTGNETREVGAGGVGAALSLLDYAVSASDTTAKSRLAALGGELTTPLGIGAELEAQELLSSVTATDSAGGLVLSLSGLELGLDDLLPADVLEALPLSVALDLIDTLGLSLSTDLLDQIGNVGALPELLQDAVTAAGDISDVQDLLAAALAELPEVLAVQDAAEGLGDLTVLLAGAEQLVGDLEGELESVTGEIADVEQAIDLLGGGSGLGGLLPDLDGLGLGELTGLLDDLLAEQDALELDLTDALVDVTAAEGDLTDAVALLESTWASLEAALDDLGSLDPTLAALLDQLADLEGFLDGLLGQIDDLLGDLDLDDLLEELLGQLTATTLLDLGALTLDLSAVATGMGSEGVATCTAEGLAVLGAPIPTPGCDDVAAALGQLDTALTGLLGALPVASGLPGVDIGGLDVSSSGISAPVDGVSTAFARVSALTLDIGSVELAGVTDDVISQLDGLAVELTGVLDGLPLDGLGLLGLEELGLDGLDLDELGLGDLDLDLMDGVLGAGGFVAPPDAIDAFRTQAISLPVGLDALLGELQADLDTLPLGDALAGLETLGLTAALGAVDVSSTFTAAGAPGTPAAPATPTTPSTPAAPAAPGAPATPAQLPRTGAALQLWALAALAALGVGGTTLMLGRSIDQGLHRIPLRGQPPT